MRPKGAKPFDALPDELVCTILARKELNKRDRQDRGRSDADPGCNAPFYVLLAPAAARRPPTIPLTGGRGTPPLSRLRSCALVCHRWHRLVGNADVLRRTPVAAHIGFDCKAWAALPQPRRLPSLDALHSWLSRHAVGLSFLRVKVHAYEVRLA